MTGRDREGAARRQDLAADQPGVFQYLDVLRRCSERDRERLRKFAYGLFATGKFPKHPSTRGVAEGVKDGTHLVCF